MSFINNRNVPSSRGLLERELNVHFQALGGGSGRAKKHSKDNAAYLQEEASLIVQAVERLKLQLEQDQEKINNVMPYW